MRLWMPILICRTNLCIAVGHGLDSENYATGDVCLPNKGNFKLIFYVSDG